MLLYLKKKKMFYISHDIIPKYQRSFKVKKVPFTLKHSDLNKTVDLCSYGQLLPLFLVQNTWAERVKYEKLYP